MYTPSGDRLTWEVSSDVIMENGCCTFRQDEDGLHMKVQIMGTVVAELYGSPDE